MTTKHKGGCSALGGFGHGIGPCDCTDAPQALRLADWLEENSSGVYRPAAEAAVLLRSMHDQVAALEAKLAAAEGDAGRYRWLMSARTEDDAAACVVNGPPPVLPQDEVISTLGSWYFHKELADSLVDAAMKGATHA